MFKLESTIISCDENDPPENMRKNKKSRRARVDAIFSMEYLNSLKGLIREKKR